MSLRNLAVAIFIASGFALSCFGVFAQATIHCNSESFTGAPPQRQSNCGQSPGTCGHQRPIQLCALTRSPPVRQPRESLTVVLNLPTGSLTFAEQDATELTPYHNGAINQRIKVLTRADWRVYFRPEADGSREEVVVELGTLGGTPTNTGAYTATITQGGKPLATVSVPQHWYRARWRWQSAPRPITGNVAKFIANGLLPPFSDATGITVEQPRKNWTLVPYKIMGNAGITLGMGSTGERPDIGLVTEYQARGIFYLLGSPLGNRQYLTQMMEQAEAAASMPLHYRDELTGKPVSVIDRPTITSHPNDIQTSGYVAPGTSEWKLDSVHFPAVSYLPYLLTGDLYHLEELQFQASWLLAHSSFGRSQGYGPQLYETQERAFAWSLRTLFQAANQSPTANPEYLLPKTYFQTILSNTHNYLVSQRVKSTDPIYSVFACEKAVLDQTLGASRLNCSVWQGAFLASSIAWGIMQGFTAWGDVLDWKLIQMKAICDGLSGWNQWVTPAYFPVGTSEALANHYTSWAHAYADYAALQPTGVPGRPNVLYCPAEDHGLQYPSYVRGALLMAIKLGRTQVQDAYHFYNEQIRLQSMRRGAGGSGFSGKWSLN